MTGTMRRLSPLWILALAAATAASARADITPDAKKVIERYLSVTGGRASFDSLSTVTIRSSISAFGLSGTSTTTTRRPDRRVTHTKLGPFQIPDGYDGKMGWRGDPSGKIAVLDGKDLEDSRASTYFENDLWLTADQGGGRVTLAGTEKDSLGSYSVLEVTPPVGRPRRFYVNTKTGLIDRATTHRDQQDIVNVLSDYRRFGTRLYPRRSVTRIVGMPANDLVGTIDSVWANPTVDDAVFRMPSPASDRISWLAMPGAARLPFDYRGRHVWLTVSVNGRPPADFLFDTGASITVIDSAYAAHARARDPGRAAGPGRGSVGECLASPSSIRSGCRARTATASSSERPEGRGAVDQSVPRAVLLARLRRRARLRLHLPLRERDRLRHAHDHAARSAVLHVLGQGRFDPVHARRHDSRDQDEARRRVRGRVPGRRRQQLDGGPPRPVRRQERPARQDGQVDRRRGRRLRRHVHEPAHAHEEDRARVPTRGTTRSSSLSGAASGALASEDYAGNIGNQILERFRCTFDYERRDAPPGARHEATRSPTASRAPASSSRASATG